MVAQLSAMPWGMALNASENEIPSPSQFLTK